MATDVNLSEPLAPARSLSERFQAVRHQTEMICDPLEPEDYGLQPMTEASPVKWHLAHTTWFFETFVLKPALPRYHSDHPEYNYLFNSYYNAIGERISRDRRGLLSRPTVGQVYRYREVIDDALLNLLDDPDLSDRFSDVVELGLQHEQQHQELILTDLKAALACNPLWPAYRDDAAEPLLGDAEPLRWRRFPEGLREIGHDPSSPDFFYDNEAPRHRAFVESYQLASRLSTVGEYLRFLEDGGYDRSDLWLSDGWAARHQFGWTTPAYWQKVDGQWFTFTLGGLRPLIENEPVTHLSFYEADAFARWSGARLPTEAEWELAAVESAPDLSGNFVETSRFHPAPARSDASTSNPAVHQLFGDTWEWTASPYIGYPGYQAAPGALGEYNGKFMCNQFVLRGGSCVSPRSHLRPTYRNFFPAESRWQFTGLRLAR